MQSVQRDQISATQQLHIVNVAKQRDDGGLYQAINLLHCCDALSVLHGVHKTLCMAACGTALIMHEQKRMRRPIILRYIMFPEPCSSLI